MRAEGTVLFGVLAGRGPGRIARNRLESFAQFTWNETFSSPLGPTPVDGQRTAGEGRKMRWVSSPAGGHAANPFSPHYHRRRGLVLPQIPARLTMAGLSR
jgi:hypothetical protein